MINKSFYIILFMYITSGFMAGGQYLYGDAFDIDITSPTGKGIAQSLDDVANIDSFNEQTEAILSAREESLDSEGSPFDCIIAFNSCMAVVVWDISTLMTGTYVFNVLEIIGVPFQFVVIFILAYSVFLIRTIAGMLRGF